MHPCTTYPPPPNPPPALPLVAHRGQSPSNLQGRRRQGTCSLRCLWSQERSSFAMCRRCDFSGGWVTMLLFSGDLLYSSLVEASPTIDPAAASFLELRLVSTHLLVTSHWIQALARFPGGCSAESGAWSLPSPPRLLLGRIWH